MGTLLIERTKRGKLGSGVDNGRTKTEKKRENKKNKKKKEIKKGERKRLFKQILILGNKQ